MKRIISLMLVAVLAVSMIAFTSCSKSDNSSSSSSSTPEKKVLHMATNAEFEPYEYKEGGKIVGIDAELAQAICDKLGYELVIDDMEFDAIITAVSTGKADFGMAGMTVTDERKESVDFTAPYTSTTQVIIVKDGSSIKTKSDLAGKKIGVQLGTTGDQFASKYEKKGSKIDRYSKGADAVMALSQGKDDCVIIDSEPAKKFVAQNQGLVILSESFEGEEYAICTAKNNKLLDELNDAITDLKDDGTVQEIIDKYIQK